LCISQFRYSAQIRPSSVVTKDYTFKRPGWAGRFDQEGQYQDYQRTQYEVYDYPTPLNDPAGQGVLIRKASTRITSARSMKCMTTPDVSRVPTGRTLPAGRWTAGETMQKPRGE
ncbi:hypothetical protein EA171_23410, partial [Escherichia coli]